MTTPFLAKYWKSKAGAMSFICSMEPKKLNLLKINNGWLVVSGEAYQKHFKK